MNMHKSLIAAAVTVVCSLGGGYALAATATEPAPAVAPKAPAASVQPATPPAAATGTRVVQPLDSARPEVSGTQPTQPAVTHAKPETKPETKPEARTEVKTGAGTEAGTGEHHEYPSFAHLDKGKLGYLTLAQTRGIEGLDFGKADTNRNGKLSKAEYDAALQALEHGHKSQPHGKHVSPAPKTVPATEG